jgi:uridylate kinase
MAVVEAGVEAAVVVGGGNIIRGEPRGSAKQPYQRATADYMGMMATMINALALQNTLEDLGAETRVMSAIRAEAVCEPYIRRRAMRHLEKKRIVLLAGGTGNPYFSTDTAAALRAMEIKADVLLKATKVDGVYSADPQQVKNAKRYPRLTHMQVLRGRLHVMDFAAISLCLDNKMPVLVYSLFPQGNTRRVVHGERLGTLIATS